jgi:hypothetical protein
MPGSLIQADNALPNLTPSMAAAPSCRLRAGASDSESRLAVPDTGSEPLLDEDELPGHEFDGRLEETDFHQRGQVGEEAWDPERAAAMLAEAEQDPEVTT